MVIVFFNYGDFAIIRFIFKPFLILVRKLRHFTLKQIYKIILNNKHLIELFIFTYMKKEFILYGVIVILIILLFNQCEKRIEKDKESDSIENFLKDSIRYYKNELGQEIAIKNALQGDKDALNVLLSKQIDSTGQLKRLVAKFKRIDAGGNITQETKIDTVFVEYDVPIPCKFNRKWNKETEYYAISGNSNELGITLENITIPNTISFAIGKKKKGLFNSEYVVEVVNSNPNIKTLGVDAYAIKVPQKRLGLSLVAGYGVSYSGLSPIIGIGLGYQLIKL